MKKILVLVPDLRLPGGVTNYYNALKLETKADVRYFTVNSFKPESGMATLLRMISKYISFFFLLLTKKISLVHVNPSLDRRSFYRDFGFILLSRLCRKDILIFFRGWEDSYEEIIKRSRFQSFLFKISYAKARRFIVLSESFKRKLICMGVPASTPFYIETTVADSSGVDDLDLQKKYVTSEKNLKLLFISRIEKEKGIFITLDAYREFQRQCPEIRVSLTVAGDGPALAAARQYVEQEQIPGVEFTGNIRGEQKKKVLLESHIMIFPTYYGEGMPNSILEGMLYGMPVISRVNAGIPDVVQQGINGFLTESIDPLTFSDFLCRLVRDREMLREMSLVNHRKGMERFTTERVRDRILAIYGEA